MLSRRPQQPEVRGELPGVERDQLGARVLAEQSPHLRVLVAATDGTERHLLVVFRQPAEEAVPVAPPRAGQDLGLRVDVSGEREPRSDSHQHRPPGRRPVTRLPLRRLAAGGRPRPACTRCSPPACSGPAGRAARSRSTDRWARTACCRLRPGQHRHRVVIKPEIMRVRAVGEQREAHRTLRAARHVADELTARSRWAATWSSEPQVSTATIRCAGPKSSIRSGHRGAELRPAPSSLRSGAGSPPKLTLPGRRSVAVTVYVPGWSLADAMDTSPETVRTVARHHRERGPGRPARLTADRERPGGVAPRAAREELLAVSFEPRPTACARGARAHTTGAAARARSLRGAGHPPRRPGPARAAGRARSGA